MDKEQLKKHIEDTILQWIARIDGLMQELQSIRNFREDNMCLHYRHALNNARCDCWALLESRDSLVEDQLTTGRFDKLCAEADKKYAGFVDTLTYLKSRPRIIKW